MAVDIYDWDGKKGGLSGGFSEGVELYNLSLCSGDVASTCRAVQETSFSFEGHTCFY